jgi:hypothetical protein
MHYYYLKIGKGNKLAKDWLEGKNPLGKPAAVIFFGPTHVTDLLQKETTEQAPGFCKAGLPENRENILAVVISGGYLWIVQPASKVTELKEEEGDIWKVMELKVLKHKSLNEVPPVLASIGSNRYLSSGTFREIKSLGNIKAIKVVLGRSLSKKHYATKNLDNLHLLECLSSVELETLIAKIFEAAGCFVPAYRGGYMKDIDLFATNDTSKRLDLAGLRIDKGQTISVQVKTNANGDIRTTANYLISLDANRDNQVFNADWMIDQAKTFPKVSSWLARSLGWLPKEYLKHFGF